MRRARGNYYATTIERRPDGRKFGRQVARQARTLDAARAALDATGERGYVQVWIEREQRRLIIAELDEAGNWWGRNVYDDTLRAMPEVTK